MRTYERNHETSGRAWLGWSLGAVLLLAGCYTGLEDTLPAEPRSLEGVDVDGALRLSPSGALVLDASAWSFFDHFLAAEGEVDEAALHARVRVEIDRQLSGEAADRAWEVFLAYLDYRREASALLHDGELEPAALLDALAEVRARTIGDAPGLPDEGPRLQTALAMQAVLSDASLDAQTRAQRIGALQAELGETPDPADPSMILRRVHAALAPIPRADHAARRAVLTELLGEAATERWLALERRRAEDLTTRG